mgnify:CR=1 FL=1
MKFFLSIVLIICSINFSLYSQEKSREVVNTGEEEEINKKRTILDDSTFNIYSAKTTQLSSSCDCSICLNQAM